MQNGQLWPSIWHHLRHPLVAELRRWGWRNSSTPLDTLSNNEGYPNHWFTRPHDWILCSPKDWYERVPWISTTSSTGLKSASTEMSRVDKLQTDHALPASLLTLTLIGSQDMLWSLSPAPCQHFARYNSLSHSWQAWFFFAICRCFFIRKPNGGFSYHPIFVSVFKLFFSGQIGPETHPWTALFPAAALAPTLSWAALGTKCLGTREDGRGLRESLPDTPIFGGKAWKKRGKNMVYAWSAADFPLSLPSDLSSTRTAGLRFRLLCNIVVPSPGTDASKVN